MARQTKDEIANQLDAAVLRANRVTLDLATLRARLGAVVALAGDGHLNLESLLDALEDIAMDEGTPPAEVENEYAVHGRAAR